MLVELLIDRGIMDAEVGTQVDHFHAPRQQSGGNLRCDAVRQGEKGHLRSRGGDRIGIGRDEGQLGTGQSVVAGKQRCDRLPGFLTRGDGTEIDMRVLQ